MIGDGDSINGIEPALGATRRRNLARRRIFGAGAGGMDDPSSPSSPDAADARWPDGNSDVEGAEERIQSLMIQRALLGADALGSNYQQYSRTTGGGGQRSDERPTSREPMDPYRNAKLFFSLFLFRSLNGLFVNTWFDPDETWQSLEVAHQTVFGVGYMTWEWKAGIRGAAHPMIFVCLYKVLQVLGLEHTHLFLTGPRIVQAAFSAFTDLFAFLYALRSFGLETAQLTLTCMIFSWFNFYCASRTYSNSVEACMTMIALYYWPSPHTPPSTRRELRIALIFAALGCIFRPTNVILWVYMGGQLLAIYPHRSRPIIYDTIVTAFFALCVSLCMDRLFYKRWVFTQWEFFRINVFEGISEFYGSHPFHWYFTQGLPLVLFTSLPFCLYGGMSKFKQAHKQQLFSMCVFTVLALSIQAHKEFRFLLPLVAPMQIFAGRQLHFIAKDDVKKGRTGSKSRLSQYLALIIVTNCIMGFYFSRIHKRGVVHAVEWLREQAYAQRVTDILFLMPCHSTPYYSHIHLDIPMRFITCEPPLGLSRGIRGQYKDETDLLYSSPSTFFDTYFSKQVGNKSLPGSSSSTIYPKDIIHKVPGQGYAIKQYDWPSHLVWYDNPKLGIHIKQILNGSDYQECARFSNGLFHDDAKQLGWFSGELNGKRGLFPGNYCRFEEDPPFSPKPSASKTTTRPLQLQQQQSLPQSRPHSSYSMGSGSSVAESEKNFNATDTRAKLAEKSSSLIKDAKIKSLDRPASMTSKRIGSYGTSSSASSSVEAVDSSIMSNFAKSTSISDGVFSQKPSVPKRPPQVIDPSIIPLRTTSPEHYNNVPSSVQNNAAVLDDPFADLAITSINTNLPPTDSSSSVKSPLKKKAPPPPPSKKPEHIQLAAAKFPSLSELAASSSATGSARSSVSSSSIAGNINAIAQKYENMVDASPSQQPPQQRKQPPPVPSSSSSASSSHLKFAALPAAAAASSVPPPIPSTRPVYNPSVPQQYQYTTNSSSSLQSSSAKPSPPVRPTDFKNAIQRYRLLFAQYDRWTTGVLSASIIKSIWTRSQLEPMLLGQIWNLLQVSKGTIGLEEIEFCCGMYVIDEVLGGKELPSSVDQIRLRIRS